MARRAALDAGDGDLYPGLERAFKLLAAAQIVRARDAKAHNLLSADDVADDGDLLTIAKELGRSLRRDGYQPPRRSPTIRVGGADARERLLRSQRAEAGLTPHQLHINTRLAEVLCRGDGPAREVSEQTLLDLERSHFLVLAQTNETQARLAHLRAPGAERGQT